MRRRKKSYDFDDRPRPQAAGVVLNIMTVIVLLMVTCVAGVVILIAVNPQSAINPFKPRPTLPLPTLFQSPTPTETLRPVLPPTWTPTPSLEPTSTPKPPTLTPTITLTSGPTDTPGPGTPSATPGGMNYLLQNPPQLIQSFSHPDCNKWMGVAGQVFDLRGGPVVGLILQVGGSLNGQLFETQTSMAGTATQYGPSGFEFTLANRPIASTNSLWIQLIDQSGLPLSDKIYFSTSDKCEQNLVLLAFKQAK